MELLQKMQIIVTEDPWLPGGGDDWVGQEAYKGAQGNLGVVNTFIIILIEG